MGRAKIRSDVCTRIFVLLRVPMYLLVRARRASEQFHRDTVVAVTGAVNNACLLINGNLSPAR